MQATSPMWSTDLDAGVNMLRKNAYDSVLSVAEVEDYFTWHIRRTEQPLSIMIIKTADGDKKLTNAI